MVLVFQILLLVYLTFCSKRFYFIVYRVYQVSIIPIQILSTLILFYFLSFGSKHTNCNKAERQEIEIFKRKENNLLIPVKLYAPIKNTDTECLKLTMQNIRLENKALKSENEQMKFRIENKYIDVKDNFPP